MQEAALNNASVRPQVGVVIVSYHSPARTCSFIREELPKLSCYCAACVVDVASTQESWEYLQGHLPAEVSRLRFEENLGYARGNNRGAEFLYRQYPELSYFIFCNDDIQFPDNHNISGLMAYIESSPRIGIIGPQVIGLDGLPQSPWDTADNLGASTEFFRQVPPSPFGGCTRACYAVRGCFFVVRASLFLQVKGFDEEYFLFFEEPVLGEKLRQKGYQSWYFADATVIHFGSATIKQSLSSWRIYLLYRRSFFLTARKYWGWSLWDLLTWPLRHLFRSKILKS